MSPQTAKEIIPGPRHGVVTIVVFTLVLFAYIVTNNSDKQSILLIVIPMGMLGATVRDYAAFKQGNQKASRSISEQLYLIVIGAIMSLIITIMFAGSVIEGTVFPTVIGGDLGFESMNSALRGKVSLETNADFYKLIIWAFIAGLSDNFVYRKLSDMFTK